MANEIKISKTLTYENGTLKYSYSPGTLNLPQSVKGYSDRTVAVTSAESDLTWGVGTPGITLLRSLESTTTGMTLQWGPKTSTGGLRPMGKLAPKQDAQITVASSTCILRWKNLTAGTIKVQVLEFEA